MSQIDRERLCDDLPTVISDLDAAVANLAVLLVCGLVQVVSLSWRVANDPITQSWNEYVITTGT